MRALPLLTTLAQSILRSRGIAHTALSSRKKLSLAPLLLLAATTTIAITTTAHAEYRAYQLAIRNTEAGTERITVSTLDHLQYPSFYPVRAGETVEYVTSWRCYGRTGGFRRICPNPKANSGDTPASTDAR